MVYIPERQGKGTQSGAWGSQLGKWTQSQQKNDGGKPKVVSPQSAAWAPLKPASSSTRSGGGSATSPMTGGSTGGSYGGGGSVGYSAPVASAPVVPSEKDFLNSDSVYLAALSNYNKQYEDLLADIERRKSDYQIDYDNSLGKLGYTAPATEGGEGQFAWDDTATAAGRAYQNLIQDFAARGMLRSGDYLTEQSNLQTSLLDQYQGMADARQSYVEGLNSEKRSGETAKTGGVAQAKAEALARLAAQYGSV